MAETGVTHRTSHQQPPAGGDSPSACSTGTMWEVALPWMMVSPSRCPLWIRTFASSATPAGGEEEVDFSDFSVAACFLDYEATSNWRSKSNQLLLINGHSRTP